MTDQPPRDREDTASDDDLRDQSAIDADPGTTPPHPSQAEGGDAEPAERPPRPSQAEGER